MVTGEPKSGLFTRPGLGAQGGRQVAWCCWRSSSGACASGKDCPHSPPAGSDTESALNTTSRSKVPRKADHSSISPRRLSSKSPRL